MEQPTTGPQPGTQVSDAAPLADRRRVVRPPHRPGVREWRVSQPPEPEAEAAAGPGLPRVVRRLSELDRRILRLRFLAGRSPEQIAQEIGIAPTQVSELLARIVRVLTSVTG